jgi:hypothetical protein
MKKFLVAAPIAVLTIILMVMVVIVVKMAE